jgi:hypothetical protein
MVKDDGGSNRGVNNAATSPNLVVVENWSEELKKHAK